MERRNFLQYIGVGASASQMSIAIPFLASLTGDPGAFLAACKSGNLARVKQYVEAHTDWASARDQDGKSGFILALLAGHHQVADLLKSHGYQTDLHEAALALDWDRFNLLSEREDDATIKLVNQIHPVGGTAMWAAATGGAGPNIWRVYARGGDPNGMLVSNSGTTPLQSALRYPDLATAELTAATLLSNNADPSYYLEGDHAPLHIAMERGSYEIAEMLIRLGADPSHQSLGLDAMQIAEKKGRADLIELLRNRDEISRTCRTSRDRYNAAGARYHKPESAQKLDTFSRLNFVGKSHNDLEYIKNALMDQPLLAHSVATTSEMCVEAGAHMGRKPIVEALLRAGAPYSLPTAVMMGDMTTTKRLLDEDPMRIHERGAHDFALLWYPIIGRCGLDMMALLLERGGKVAEQHYLGTTALHWACLGGDLPMIEMLLENGADINRKGRKFGGIPRSPLQMAREDNVIAYLKDKGAIE